MREDERIEFVNGYYVWCAQPAHCGESIRGRFFDFNEVKRIKMFQIIKNHKAECKNH